MSAIDAIGGTGGISGVSGIAGGSGQGNASSALDGLDSNAFLQLLVTQLKHQDPTSPADSTEYMAQLATYANVEQNTKTNNKLDEVLAAVSVANASALLGRAVTSPDGSVTGTVTGYTIFGNGVMLLLDNGERLVLQPGISVSDE